jgi:hypothetical protein
MIKPLCINCYHIPNNNPNKRQCILNKEGLKHVDGIIEVILSVRNLRSILEEVGNST